VTEENLVEAELEIPTEQPPEDELPPDDELPPEDELPPDDEPVEKPLTRGEQRHQKLANEAAEARAEAKALREQAEFYRKQAEEATRQRQAPSEDVYIDPDEKWRRDTESKVNQALFSAHDLNDKAAYAMQAVKNPLYTKYEAKVDAELQSIRAKGGNATREGILDYLIGKDIRTNHGKPTKTAAAAQNRVAAARTTTPGVRSNVTTPKKESTTAERLAGVIL
jgi:hypothetical protein